MNPEEAASVPINVMNPKEEAASVPINIMKESSRRTI
jgi:hypothetical protein